MHGHLIPACSIAPSHDICTVRSPGVSVAQGRYVHLGRRFGVTFGGSDEECLIALTEADVDVGHSIINQHRLSCTVLRPSSSSLSSLDASLRAMLRCRW